LKIAFNKKYPVTDSLQDRITGNGFTTGKFTVNHNAILSNVNSRKII